MSIFTKITVIIFVSQGFDSNGKCGCYVSDPKKSVAYILARSSLGKSVNRLTDRPDMTIAFYHGRKTTTQQQQ